MKTDILDFFDPFPFIGFSCNFMLTCDTNVIHEGAKIWIINYFKNKSASAVLNTKLLLIQKALTRMTSKEKSKNFTTYPHVFNYFS